MKKLFSRFVASICDRYGVSRKELAYSAACVILGGAYLVYTYCVISVLA